MSRYTNIIAKVSPQTAARMDNVVAKLGLRSKYEFMQLALALVLKYVDSEAESADPETQEQIETLRGLWGDVSRLRHEVARVKPNGGRKVEPTELIAFYGKECLMLRVMDAEGNSLTTTNQRDVLEAVLAKTLPAESLTQLRAHKRQHRFPTLFAALISLMRGVEAEYSESDEVQQMFHVLEDSDPRTVRLGRENKPARSKNKKKFE